MSTAQDGDLYQIRLKEELDQTWLDWFGEGEIAVLESGETQIRVRLADQAALHGLLMKIRDLNLTLISVELP